MNQTEIKYHSTFGEVTILSLDANFTTIIINSTGEQKKLVNKYANLTDSPIEKIKVKKVVSKQRELTEEEKERAEKMVDSDMREAHYIAGLSPEARLAYRSNKSKRIALS
jgi:hypothetical protein